MSARSYAASPRLPGVISALGEQPVFNPGDAVRILTRSPVGHYRMPIYLRGKTGSVEAVIEPVGVDNEEQGFGRNAGSKRHYYRIALPMTEIEGPAAAVPPIFRGHAPGRNPASAGSKDSAVHQSGTRRPRPRPTRTRTPI
jgi:hypothetical protein